MLPALKYTVRHYGCNYSVISEKSECGRLRYYATIESLYGANCFTVTVRKRNGNFSMTPTVHSINAIVMNVTFFFQGCDRILSEFNHNTHRSYLTFHQSYKWDRSVGRAHKKRWTVF